MARNATAFEVADRHSEEARKPGAYCFMLNGAGLRMGIVHACPCGCGGQSAMWFAGLADAGGPEWHVDGEWPKVTLTPSIGIGRQPEGGYHWHGFLENGEFVER
jgi:Family of unknown function (DUF6527)